MERSTWTGAGSSLVIDASGNLAARSALT